MIFIVRVSDSERLSNFHKIFINVKIFDSSKISDYEKAGSEVVSSLQPSCPTRSGISYDRHTGILDCHCLRL